MANKAALKLPEFWESAAAAWFAQAEAQFAIHGITDDDARYYHVVAALGSSTASRAVNFITSPPTRGMYNGLKALLIKTFELSRTERAGRLLDIAGLGDRKPSEHMEMMLSLLGREEPNFLFIELFLRHMPPHVRTALANTTTTDPRALAEEADLFFLATQRPTPERLTPLHDRHPDTAPPDAGRRRPTPEPGDGLCYFHARFGAKAKKCRPPCKYVATAGNGGACAQ